MREDEPLRREVDAICGEVLRFLRDAYAADYRSASELELRAADSERLAAKRGTSGGLSGDWERQLASELRVDAAQLRARADAGWPGGLGDWERL